MKLVLILIFAAVAGGSAIVTTRAILDQATTGFTASIGAARAS